MNKEIFIERYKRFNVSEKDIKKCIQTIINFEQFVDKDIDNTSVDDLELYIDHTIKSNQNTYDNFIHIARYYYYINKQQEYIHMTKIFNSIGVLENIIERIELYSTKDLKETFINNIKLPPIGTSSEALPMYTKDFYEKLEVIFGKERCKKILAGNNHGIPKEVMMKEKELYEASNSLEEYLKERHKRKVVELQEHLDNNKIWFEQVITNEVVDYVKSNQEVLSATLEDDTLYITKIPYDVNNYLETSDETLKKYYACHCSFVRENILNHNFDIPKNWCYCSGGFAKFPFEVVLDHELDITLLETPLDGDMKCRFKIDLKNIPYKK